MAKKPTNDTQDLVDQITQDPQINDAQTEEVTNVGQANANGDNPPADPGDQTDTPEEAEVTVTVDAPDDAPEVIEAGEPPAQIAPTTDTTAPLEPWHDQPGQLKVPVSTGQSEETLKANEPTAEKKVIGVLAHPLSDKELDDELDNITGSEFDDWVYTHWKNRTATIDGMARVSRYKIEDIKDILREKGAQFPAGF